MKKVLLFIVCLGLLFASTFALVHADETEPAADPSVTDPAPATEPETETETEKIDEKAFAEKIESYLSQYVGDSLAIKIIEWLVDAGVLTAALGVWIKYRKYKNSTTDEVIGAVKNELGTNLKEAFDKLSVEEINKLKNAIEKLEQANETIMKVLVLMQDNTAKGKVALLEYLGTKTGSEEVKQAVEETTEKIEEKIEETQEVLDKVSGTYEDIKF